MHKIPHVEQNWISPATTPIPDGLQSQTNFPEIILQTLLRRGIADSESIVQFVDTSRYIPASAAELPDLEKGVQRVSDAVKKGKTIGVWGDFDVDGQTATSVLVSSLRHIGANVEYHIPIRAEESHGITLPALKTFLARGVDVLLTCDTGVSAFEAISYAQSIGIDVVVTDHHMLPEVFPPAYAVINPRRLNPDHPLASLPGVGTAFKFAESLLTQFTAQEFSKSLLDLVALGAIADLAELTADTRYLVQSGLSMVRSSPRPALAAMLQATEVDHEHFSAEHVSYMIAPRLNAVGRLGDANPMVEFLLSEDPIQIAVTVNQLEGLNARRKILCDQVFNGALSFIERDRSFLDQPLLILDHPDWPAGVVGIVASRLVEMFHRPVILLVSPPGQPMRGSARSVEGIDITAALVQNQKLLSGFGGHPMAAGMSLEQENYSAFKRGMSRSVAHQACTSTTSTDLMIDGWMPLSTFSLDLLKSFDALAPFGPGNPPLLFAEKSLTLTDSKAVGKMKEHLQVTVEDQDARQIKLIWWNAAHLPLPESKFDLAYTVHSSNYRGQEGVQFEWIDYRMTEEKGVVSLRKAKKQIVNHDHRLTSQPQSELAKVILEESELLIWREGSYIPTVEGMNRNSLHPEKTLVIWSTPPSFETLQDMIKTVKPDHIHWFLQPSQEQQLAVFPRSLARIVKDGFAIGQNEFFFASIAAQTALTPAVVELGIKWLASEGNITITQLSSQSAEIISGGVRDDHSAQMLKLALRGAFEELGSFSDFLRRIDLDILLLDLG